MDSTLSAFEWYEQEEGRASERCRRLSFNVLFGEDGRPGYWLLAVALVGAVVAVAALVG